MLVVCLLMFVFSVDATFTTRIGKFINDSSRPNCRVKAIKHFNQIFFCLFALTDIDKGTEIRYSYGAPGLVWRKVCIYNVKIVISLTLLCCILKFVLHQKLNVSKKLNVSNKSLFSQ